MTENVMEDKLNDFKDLKALASIMIELFGENQALISHINLDFQTCLDR